MKKTRNITVNMSVFKSSKSNHFIALNLSKALLISEYRILNTIIEFKGKLKFSFVRSMCATQNENLLWQF